MYLTKLEISSLEKLTYLTILAVLFALKLTLLLSLLPMYVLQMIVGMTVPHQNAADGTQYAVSAKATTKDDHVSNDDVNKQQENQEVCILYDICTYITIRDWSSVTKDIPTAYSQQVYIEHSLNRVFCLKDQLATYYLINCYVISENVIE